MSHVLRVGEIANAPNIAERIALIRIDGQPYEYDMSILLTRVVGSRWIVSDPDSVLTIDDLAAEEVIPLIPGGAYPLDGRPFLIRDVTEAWLMGLRARARALADMHGAPAVAPLVGTDTGGKWLYADTAHPNFGEEVAAERLGVAVDVRLEDFCGLLRERGLPGGDRWTFIELVTTSDLEKYKQDKREGMGRDPRLSGLHPTTLNARPLFRVAHDGFSKQVEPDRELFEGPLSVGELCASISSSGLEPMAYLENFVISTGVSAKSGAATELKTHIFTLQTMAIHDRLNIPRLASAQHIARRVLQLMKALRRNPHSPDLEGLHLYLHHMDNVTSGANTPRFDKYVTEVQKPMPSF